MFINWGQKYWILNLMDFKKNAIAEVNPNSLNINVKQYKTRKKYFTIFVFKNYL